MRNLFAKKKRSIRESELKEELSIRENHLQINIKGYGFSLLDNHQQDQIFIVNTLKHLKYN